MTTPLWIGGYLLTAIAAFWLFQHDWRREWGLSWGQALFFALTSLTGPLALLVAVLSIFMRYVWSALPNGDVLPRRKP